MHSQHFLAAAERVHFRKRPEFVVFRFGLSRGLRQRRQPRRPGNEDALQQAVKGARVNDHFLSIKSCITEAQALIFVCVVCFSVHLF